MLFLRYAVGSSSLPPPSCPSHMKHGFLLPLLLAAMFSVHLPAQAKSLETGIGVWPFLVSSNIDSYQNEIIQKAKSTGLDTIYMHVFSVRGSQTGILRIKDEAKAWSSTWGKVEGRISLAGFIDKAHKAGLQVVGVVQVFYSPKVLPSDRRHQKYMTEKVLRYFVKSRDRSGKPIYPLDGIAFDYIRWFGGKHDPSEINRFLDAARLEMGAMPIHAYVVAGAYALDGPTYDAKFRSYANLRSYLNTNYGQDWEAMAKRIDVLMPMAYTANGHVYKKDTIKMQAYLQAVAAYARIAVTKVGSKCRVVPAIRTWNSAGETTTKATVTACAKGAMLGGADGYTAFRYFTARSHADWFKALSDFAQPGFDLPIARWTATMTSSQFSVDASASTHSKFASSQLTARYDLDGDGRFEQGPYPLAKRTLPLSGAGPRTISVKVSDPRGKTAVASLWISPPLTLTPYASVLSASLGGKTSWTLNQGLAYGQRPYLVLGTLSGTSPGLPITGGPTLPINFDLFTSLGLSSLNQGPFVRFFGKLSIFGLAYPELAIPKGLVPASLVGKKMHFAIAIFKADLSAVDRSSNAVQVLLTR